MNKVKFGFTQGLNVARLGLDELQIMTAAQMADRLGISREKNNKWFEITHRIEETTKRWMLENKKQAIYPNVDLYSASIYYSMRIPMDLNTPIFAISRIAGWTAHVIEEKFAEAAPKPALYRPKAVYIGKYCGPMGCEYTPLQNRNSI